MTILIGIALVTLGTLIGSFGALFLKLGSKNFSMSPTKIIRNWHLILGCFLYLVSSIPFIISLKFGPLSVMYPFVATSYIWVTCLSIIVLKEKMTFFKWLGIISIIAGVAFIGLGS